MFPSIFSHLPRGEALAQKEGQALFTRVNNGLSLKKEACAAEGFEESISKERGVAGICLHR